MKKVVLLFGFAVLCLTGCKSKVQEALPPLTIDAKSRYQIVVPDRFANRGTQLHLLKAADMLRKAFQEGVGADFPVVTEAKKVAGVKGIYLGNSRKIREWGVRPLQAKGFDFLIAERDGDLFLAGHDGDRFGRTKPSARHLDYVLGSVKAATTFAERFLDTRFLLPGEAGTDFGKVGKVEIPRNYLSPEQAPLLIATGRHNDMLFDYASNNYGAGSWRSYGGHSYYSAVPKEKYAQSHPEYFAVLQGGKRNSANNHLCIGNPEVQELIYQEMLKQLDAGAGIVELAQTDGYLPCECGLCAKYGNTADPGEKLWILHRALAERLHKERPGKKVMIIAYHPTQNPPKSFREFPPNVMIELCQYDAENFAAWSKVKVPGGFIVYIYNWGWYNLPGLTPKRTPEFCSAQVRRFLNNGVRGVYRCGYGENFGLEGPAYYVFNRSFSHPEKSASELTGEFISRAYHESAAPMRDFFRTLYERMELYSRLAEKPSVAPKNPRALLTMIYSPDLIESMEKNLARAEKMANSPKVKLRLELVRREFDYTKNLARTLAFYNAYRRVPDKANFDQLARSIEERNAMIDSWFDAKNRWKKDSRWPEMPNFGASRAAVMVNGRSGAEIGAPLSWNIPLLREKKVLPGARVSSMTISRSKGKVEGFDFEAGPWKEAKWEELNGIQLGKVSEQTRFKVLRDDKNIYFAVESELPDDRKHVAFGADGPAWRQDCIELIIDPFGTRERYFHFIYNPVENSSYESAYGTISDVLHPLYGKPDPSWNGKWSYRNMRKGGKWYSLVTIPFESLGVGSPAPGTGWCLNVGREIKNPKPGSGFDAELALWSPSLETLTFHDMAAFGEAAFE